MLRTNQVTCRKQVVPSEIQKRFEFGQELYWIRAKVDNSKKVTSPKLRGIFPNTVWALNNVTVENEVLGSGTGEPGISLSFSKSPVLKGQVIEIKEPTIPSIDELKTIEAEVGKDALRTVIEDGEIKEVWILWSKTRDFALSNSLSRHYMLDRVNGEITFGNGIHGMVPPKGNNNIVARRYQSGGGKKGDVAADTITSLKTTIPNIENVTNKVSASGGMDQEDLESAVNRGPYTLKNEGRAVTKEYFEWLSYEASQYVAKARCILENREIKVIVVPRYEGDTPLPEASFLDLIERYLKERALISISNRISVLGPEYVTIDAEVKFKPTSLDQRKIAADRIVERVKLFLHPLKGGQNEEGWDFGQAIFISSRIPRQLAAGMNRFPDNR
jgi:predicted phage baseplate assembly protein